MALNALLRSCPGAMVTSLCLCLSIFILIRARGCQGAEPLQAPNFYVDTPQDLHEVIRKTGVVREVDASQNATGTKLLANVMITTSVLEIDEPFIIDYKDNYFAAISNLFFAYFRQGRISSDYAVIRCRKAKTAFIIRSLYGAATIKGNLQIENCGDTAVVIETLPEPEVSEAYFASKSFYEVPFGMLEGLRLVNNTGRDGGAVRVHGALMQLKDVTFTNNTALRGAAVFMTGQSSLNQMTGCRFDNNRVWSPSQSPSDINRGGAIHLDRDVCVGNITTTTFRNNVGSRGGALLIGGHTSRCSTKRFFPCDVACERRLNDTGALNFYMGPGLVFEGNKAFYDGGGLFVIQEHPELGSEGLVDRCQFKNNEAVLGSGGALWCQAGQGLVVVNSSMEANRAGRGGGGISFSGSNFGFLWLNESSLRNNRVLISAEQVFASHPSAPLLNWDTGSGGAIAATGFMGVSLNNDTLTNNSAPLQGGGLFCYSCNSIEVLDTKFEDNTAGGGGGALSVPLLLATSRIEFSTFSRNQVTGDVRVTEQRLSSRSEPRGVLAAAGGEDAPPPPAFPPSVINGISQSSDDAWGSNGSDLAIDDDPSNGFVYGGNLSSLLGPCGSGGAGGGGALCVQPLSSRVSLSDLHLKENRAKFGGSIYLETLFCEQMQRTCPVQLANITIDSMDLGEVNDTSHGTPLYITSTRDQDQVLSCLLASNSSRLNATSGPVEAATETCPLQLQAPSSRMSGMMKLLSSRPATLAVRNMLISGAVANEEQFSLEVTPLDSNGALVGPLDVDLVISIRGEGLYVTSPPITLSGNGSVVLSNINLYGSHGQHRLVVAAEHQGQVVAQGSVTMRIRPCRVGEVSITDKLCRSCKVPGAMNTYSFNPENNTCDSCPDHALCYNGSMIVPKGDGSWGMTTNGFWHSHPRSPIIHYCPLRSACIYENRFDTLLNIQRELEPHLGEYRDMVIQSQVGQVEPNLTVYQQALCRPGYTGVLCGSCQEGYGRLRQSCRACHSPTRSWGFFVGMLVVDAVIITALLYLRYRRQKLMTMNSQSQRTDSHTHSSEERAHETPVLSGGRGFVRITRNGVGGGHPVPSYWLHEGIPQHSSGTLSPVPGDLEVICEDNSEDGVSPRLEHEERRKTFELPSRGLSLSAERGSVPPEPSSPLGSDLAEIPASVPPTPGNALAHQDVRLWQVGPGTLARELVNPYTARSDHEASPAIFEIVVIYAQVLGTLARINLPWPSRTLTFLNVVNVPSGKLNWSSVDCLMPSQSAWMRARARIMVGVLIPVPMAAFFIAVWSLVHYYSIFRALGLQGMMRTTRARYFAEVVVAVLAQVLLYYYTTVSTTLLSLLACRQVDSLRGGIPYRGYIEAIGSFWTQEYSTRCFNGSHMRLSIGLGIPGLVVFSIGLPLLALIFLIINRRRLHDQMFRHAFGMLYENYSHQYYFWTIVNFSFLLSLTIVAESLHSLGATVQLVVYMGVITLFSCIHLAYFPYRTLLLNGLYCLAMYSSLVTAYLSLSFAGRSLSENWRTLSMWLILGINLLTLVLLGLHLFMAALGYTDVIVKGVRGAVSEGYERGIKTVKSLKSIASMRRVDGTRRELDRDGPGCAATFPPLHSCCSNQGRV